MGWAGKDNGELLGLAEADFDVFLTVDRNLSYQQNLARIGIRVVVLVAHGNRFADLAPLIPAVLDALASLSPGQLIKIGAPAFGSAGT